MQIATEPREARLFQVKCISFTLEGLHHARAWLSTPARALGGEVPLEFGRVESGAREVELVLGRIEYGVFT